MKNIEISQLTNFDIKKPTYMDATFALSKFGQNFPNRFLRESDKNFGIFRTSIQSIVQKSYGFL